MITGGMKLWPSNDKRWLIPAVIAGAVGFWLSGAWVIFFPELAK